MIRQAWIGMWAAALLLAGSGHVQGATLAVDMVPGGALDASLGVETGDGFDVDVLVQDVLDLAAFQFDLTFDAALLTATSVTSGDIFGLDTFPIDDSIGAGAVSFAEISLGAFGVDVPGSTLLARIHFTALAAGVAVLDLGGSILGDSLGGPIDVLGEADGSLTIRQPPGNVPEPSVALLSLLAACGLGFRSRRGRRGAVASR